MSGIVHVLKTEFQEVLDFWFGKPDDPYYGKPRQSWFTKKAEFDREVRSRFLTTYEGAARGDLDNWQELPLSCLALIVVLDQFPRNMFRNLPQAFATDNKALAIAQQALSKGFADRLLPVQRWFIYLPFEHSENLEHQYYALQLFSTLKNHPESLETIRYAHLHLQVIERFGRFPHRNQILGRDGTKEEKEFLQQSGAKF